MNHFIDIKARLISDPSLQTVFTARFRQRDAGNIVRITVVEVVNGADVAIDISTATRFDFVWVSPNGNVLVRAGTFVTDGADGVIRYRLKAKDLGAFGGWSLYAHIVMPNPDIDLFSEAIEVTVDPAVGRGGGV